MSRMCHSQCPSRKVTPCLAPSIWPAVIVQISTMISLSEGALSLPPQRGIVPDAIANPRNIDSDYDTELTSIAEIDKTKTFELPDRSICLSVLNVSIALILLQPSFIGKEASGFHNTSFKYNAKCDADIGTAVSFQIVLNVVLSSDTAMFQGTGMHMFQELTALAPFTIMVVAPAE